MKRFSIASTDDPLTSSFDSWAERSLLLLAQLSCMFRESAIGRPMRLICDILVIVIIRLDLR